jgi:hypothetical protein
MRTKMTLSVLFLSAACATPTFANYFHNPCMNLNANIGSAPSPTPHYIRENRQPHAAHADPSHSVVPDAVAKKTDKFVANDHQPVQDGTGQNIPAALP